MKCLAVCWTIPLRNSDIQFIDTFKSLSEQFIEIIPEN